MKTANKYSTNYFTRQEEARSNSRKLVILFTIAVAAIIVVIYLALRMIWFLSLLSENSKHIDNIVTFDAFTLWDPPTFFITAAVVSLVIAIASTIKMRQLRGGGAEIAEMLGGTLIPRNTHDPAERQLLNVIEEMAIASGVPVPLVYVLNNENGINAFAAGLTLKDAAVAVTRGSLDRLNRDELQGIIGHEFSHILNGDTRLNVQLIGIIFGILVIGIIGGKIVQNVRGSRKSGGLIILTGLALLIIGYVGSFMGRLIQSAVSRQKEFLADASAIQFTRNPDGLVGALKKIGGYISGSKIRSSSARQASHMFFGESHTDFLFPNFLATHPPLVERIKRLDPHFNGVIPTIKSDDNLYYKTIYGAATSGLHESTPVAKNAVPVPAKPQDITRLVGNPTEKNLAQSAEILAAISDNLKQTLNTPAGASFVMYALLMESDCKERENQLKAILPSPGNKDDIERVTSLCDLIADLKDDQKLPLVELALPQLRSLTDMEKRNFLKTINALIIADGKTTLFEFTIQWILNQYLIRDKEDLFAKTTYFSIPQVGYHIVVILNALANTGNTGNAEAAKAAFNAGIEQIPELASKKPDFVYDEKIKFSLFGTALKQLALSSFKIKQSVVDACAHCAFADKTITIEEMELLRAVSLTMHCPLPPFAASDK
jgi:Zn-dependent protease with chaperone function